MIYRYLKNKSKNINKFISKNFAISEKYRNFALAFEGELSSSKLG